MFVEGLLVLVFDATHTLVTRDLSIDHLAAVDPYLYTYLLRLTQVLVVIDLPLAVECLRG